MPSSAPSPAWRSGAKARRTTSGPGATACTAWRCASRPSSCARWPRSSMPSCCAAATRRCASSTTCSTTATAGPMPTRWRLSWALADAAADAGIGLTLLPVLYERAGFAQPALREDQRRFATDADGGAGAAPTACAGSGRPLLNAGVAIHSLRAAAPASIHAAGRTDWATCRSTSTSPSRPPRSTIACRPPAQRPIEWLARHAAAGRALAAGACHARHAAPRSTRWRAAAPAWCICPSTEGNLGDGLADLPGWLASRRAAVDRLGQPCHARLARGAALAGIRPAPAAPPAQRQRRAGRRRAVDRGAAVRPRTAGRRLRLRASASWGLHGRRARRPAGHRLRRTPTCWAFRPSGCWTRWSSPARVSPSAT